MKKFYTIPSSNGKERYKVWVDFDEEGNIREWSCTCQFGSVWRFNKKMIGKRCKHFKEVIDCLILQNSHKKKEEGGL